MESDGTVHVNEIEGVLRLGLVRTGGSFGQVSVSWRATESSALGNGVDYETDSGVVTFQDLEVCMHPTSYHIRIQRVNIELPFLFSLDYRLHSHSHC